MGSIAEATPVLLTDDERAELESLVRSTKTEYRTRLKAQIVLMAADGAATRAIAREVGCAIRIVSKWRMRYARDRLAGFDETGNRGAAPKYGPEAAASWRFSTRNLPRVTPTGWVRSLPGRSATCMSNMSGGSFAPRRSTL